MAAQDGKTNCCHLVPKCNVLNAFFACPIISCNDTLARCHAHAVFVRHRWCAHVCSWHTYACGQMLVCDEITPHSTAIATRSSSSASVDPPSLQSSVFRLVVFIIIPLRTYATCLNAPMSIALIM